MSDELPEEVTRAMLDDMRQRYEAGDKSQLIGAIRFCGAWKIIMPEWVVDEFHKASNRWYRYDVKELGEALGLTWPKGEHLNALKKKRKHKYDVYNRVTRAHKHGVSLESLFVEIGNELGIGKTLAAEYYYEVKAFMEPDFRKK